MEAEVGAEPGMLWWWKEGRLVKALGFPRTGEEGE